MNIRIKRNIVNPLLFILPAFAVYTIFVVYPFFSNIHISLTDWTGMEKTYNYIGFSNFIKAFKINLVSQSLLNTVIFTIGNTFGASVLGLILALALDQPLKTRNFMKSVFFIPCIMSTTVVGTLWGYMYSYDGIINAVLAKFNLSSLANDWVGNDKTALFMMLVTQYWQWLGFCAIIYIANLQVIPQDMYEAARIDGASGFAMFFNITLPMLIPSITINSVTSFVGGLRTFDLVFVLTRGGPGYSTSTIGYAIYNLGFENQQMAVGCALSLILLAVTFVVSIIQLRFFKSREIEQ
jgi:ABC-type sugar transport systems, permease components